MGASCSSEALPMPTTRYSHNRDPCSYDTTSTTTEAPRRRSANRSDCIIDDDDERRSVDEVPVVHPPLNRRSSTQSTSTNSSTNSTTPTKVWRSILNDDEDIIGKGNNIEYYPEEVVSTEVDHQSCMRVAEPLMPGTPIDEDEFGFSNNNTVVLSAQAPKLDFELFLLAGSNGADDEEFQDKSQPYQLSEEMGASLTRSSNTTASDASLSTPCGGSGGSYVLVRALDGRIHRRRHFKWFNTATPTSSFDEGAAVTPMASFKCRLHRSVTFLDVPTDDDAILFDHE